MRSRGDPARSLLFAALLLAGCARSTQLSDAGADGGESDADVHDAATFDAGCDVSPVPAGLPPLTGGFEVIDPDGGIGPPLSTGGDPRGVWIFGSATLWVERDATATFNPYASSVTGTAWIAIDETSFRLDYELRMELAGTAVGTVARSTSTLAHARYRIDREQLEPTGLVCQSSSAAPTGDAGRITFTATRDHLTVSTEVASETGPVILVLEGTRAP